VKWDIEGDRRPAPPGNCRSKPPASQFAPAGGRGLGDYREPRRFTRFHPEQAPADIPTQALKPFSGGAEVGDLVKTSPGRRAVAAAFHLK